jgi:hypothetical protein
VDWMRGAGQLTWRLPRRAEYMFVTFFFLLLTLRP